MAPPKGEVKARGRTSNANKVKRKSGRGQDKNSKSSSELIAEGDYVGATSQEVKNYYANRKKNSKAKPKEEPKAKLKGKLKPKTEIREVRDVEGSTLGLSNKPSLLGLARKNIKANKGKLYGFGLTMLGGLTIPYMFNSKKDNEQELAIEKPKEGEYSPDTGLDYQTYTENHQQPYNYSGDYSDDLRYNTLNQDTDNYLTENPYISDSEYYTPTTQYDSESYIPEYSNLSDYVTNGTSSIPREEILELQNLLGVTPTGVWDSSTRQAYINALQGGYSNLYDTSGLEAAYQRKQQYGY